jgi:hypothetical protein
VFLLASIKLSVKLPVFGVTISQCIELTFRSYEGAHATALALMVKPEARRELPNFSFA